MIQVQAVTDTDGCLTEICLEGHAGYAGAGSDIVCSAVTALIRTAARLVSNRSGIDLDDIQSEPGKLGFRIIRYSSECEQWLKGVTEYCLLGLQDLEEEFGRHLTIRMTRRKG
jgi:uncharacterized protein YsxB (DUF464 family)